MISLEYQTPEPPGPANPFSPVMRFGLGAGLGGAIVGAISALYDPPIDDPCCALMGAALSLLIWCGLFQLGVVVRVCVYGQKLQERRKVLTLACGSAMVIAFAVMGELFDKSIGSPEHAEWLVFSGFVAIPLLSSWISFRPKQMTTEKS